MDNTPNTYHTDPRHNDIPPHQTVFSTSSAGLSTAALVLGILAVLFACCGGSLFFGAFGIILAVLSRGSSNMSGSAKAGLGLSIGGLVLGIIICAIYFSSFLFSQQGRSMIDAIRYGSYYYDDPKEYENYLYDYFYGNDNDFYNQPFEDFNDDFDNEYEYDDGFYRMPDEGDYFTALPEDSFYI